MILVQPWLRKLEKKLAILVVCNGTKSRKLLAMSPIPIALIPVDVTPTASSDARKSPLSDSPSYITAGIFANIPICLHHLRLHRHLVNACGHSQMKYYILCVVYRYHDVSEQV